MKYSFIFLLLLLNLPKLSAQEFLDTIAQQACVCLEEADKSQESQQLNMELGICLIKKSQPYKAQIKETFDLDMDQMDGPMGERLGQLIGMRMVNFRPELLIQMTAGEEEQESPPIQNVNFEGEVIDILKSEFVTFMVKDESGTIQAFLWMIDFPSSDMVLEQLDELKGKNVAISFHMQDLFDYQLKKYRNYYIITGFEIK